MAKNNRNKERIERSRSLLDDSMDSLLNDDSLLEDFTDTGNLPQVTPNETHDYVAMKSITSNKAKKTITALMKFYLDEDIIEEDEYIRARKRIDEMTLSSLMFQLESAEKALVTLLRTIDSGELAPRMFEVLATLQKSMLDIIKSQTMYLVAAEESVKKLARDLDVFSQRKEDNVKKGPDSIGNSGYKAGRGTKNLMQQIQDEIASEEAQDIDDEDIEENES